MKKIIIIISLITLTFISINAQKAELLNPQNYYYSGKLAMFSTFVEKSDEADSMQFNLFYKVIQNNLLFVQQSDGKYFAQYAIEITFADAEGVVRFHKIYKDSLFTEKSRTSNYDFKYINNLIKFNIPNRKYSLNIRTTDLNSRQIYDIELGYLYFSKSSNKSFSFLFASKISNKEDFTIDPINNNLVFSAEKIKLYLFIPNSQNYNQIKYKISRLKENVDYWKEKVELNGKLENVSKIPSFRKSRENIISNSNLSENEISATSADYSATLEYYEINFAKNPFVPGIYEMQIYLSSKDTLSARFRVDWDNMPLTLTNMPIALKVSELFFNKSEMKKISDGNRVEQFIKLNGAWKNFNPNMDSKYNEAFEEYYRRADYAYFHFATFAQKNGAFTDKARIYILNGPPDEIKESFKNGKLFEKWTYRRVIKEYTFESVSAGVLKLVQIKE